MKKTLPIVVLCLLLCACAKEQSPLSDNAVREAADAAVSWQIDAYPTMNDLRVHKSDGDLVIGSFYARCFDQLADSFASLAADSPYSECADAPWTHLLTFIN